MFNSATVLAKALRDQTSFIPLDAGGFSSREPEFEEITGFIRGAAFVSLERQASGMQQKLPFD